MTGCMRHAVYKSILTPDAYNGRPVLFMAWSLSESIIFFERHEVSALNLECVHFQVHQNME